MMKEELTTEDLKLFREVEQIFLSSGESIRDTALQMQISRTKVRKILITLGTIESEITSKALEMLNSGISQKKAAERLGISEATLSTYLPYGNRVYNRNEKTSAAIRTEECRARQVRIASRQIGSRYISERKMIMKNSAGETNQKTEIKRTVNNAAMKLHLELEAEDDELEAIRRYGKAEKSISRDILVPGDMTLHALHYAVQKCFGWQNSHLHCFTLPKEIFSDLNQDKFMNWILLCGQYFRMPYSHEDGMADVYWDDDYTGGMSFNRWLKKKYRGPYRYGGFYEMYAVAQNNLRGFIEDCPEIELGPTFEEFMNGKTEHETVKVKDADIKRMELYFNHNMEELLERLKLSEIFTRDGYDRKDIINTAEERDRKFDEFFDNWSNAQDKSKWSLENTPDVKPLTDRLAYSYDYGDGWTVNITCTEIYSFTGTENQSSGGEITVNMYGSDGINVDDEELKRQVAEVFAKRSPVCLAADGLAVMDDVGGTPGYSEFLEKIYDKEVISRSEDGEEEREELLDWARGMGWNGRRTSPARML